MRVRYSITWGCVGGGGKGEEWCGRDEVGEKCSKVLMTGG